MAESPRYDIGIQASIGEGAPASAPPLDVLPRRWAGYMATEAPDIVFRCRACEHLWTARPVGLQPLFTTEAGGVVRFTGMAQTAPLGCPQCNGVELEWRAPPAAQRQFEDEMRARQSRPRYIRGEG